MVFISVCVSVHVAGGGCVCEVGVCEHTSATVGKGGNLICISDANKVQFDFVAFIIK